MKKLIAVLLALICLMSVVPLNVFAANEVENDQVIYLEDGNYMVVTVETSPARVANTVSGSKTFSVYNADDEVLWKLKVTATFAYSGAWYTCTKVSGDVTIYNSNWYVITKNPFRSNNNASVELIMGRKHNGVTVEQPHYVFTMTCNIDGTLS